VNQVIAPLRQRGRLTYRTLQLQFQLDEAHLEALQEQIISGQRLACDAEQRNGLELMRALSLPQQKQAIIFQSIIATDLPPERYTPPDGCQPSVSFKDNVVIPYEGIRADALTPGQRHLLLT
jgi:hypothetical protein